MDCANGQPLANRSLIVLLNDFCDIALVDIGISLTIQRLKSLL